MATRRAAQSPPRARRMGRPSADFSARVEILRGASEAFGRGYAATSVEDICEAAGVSRRTFYRSFRNKDEVFEALFDTAAIVLVQSMRDAAQAAATPLEKVDAAIHAFLRTHAQAGPVAATLVLESLRPDSPLAERRKQVTAGLAAMIEEEMAALGRERVDPLLVRGLVAALEHVAVTLYTEGRVTEARIRRLRRVMVRIFAASLAAPGDPIPPLPTARRGGAPP